MSTLSRITSGSLAMWARMLVTLFSQVFFVPVYLTYWDANLYGVWLAVQAAVTLLTLLDTSHQTFYENEFLQISLNDINKTSKYLCTAAVCGWSLSLIQILIIVIVYVSGGLSLVVGLAKSVDTHLARDVFISLLFQCITWTITQSLSGLMGRAISSLGHFSRNAWWGLMYVIASAVAPVISVVLGGKILAAGLTQCAVILIYETCWILDAYQLLRKKGFTFVAPDFTLGRTNILKSSLVVVRQLLVLCRQNGFRLLMAPMVTMKALAEFSTQRTVANVALQGLNSIYGPVMPELMRYVSNKQQENMEGMFLILWGFLTLIVGPLFFALQIVMPFIYPIWTHHVFVYDGSLFFQLSAAVIFYMVGLPGMAICTGHNLLRKQLLISVVSTGLLIGSLIVFLKMFGLSGAATALSIAEISSAALYTYYAYGWLKAHGMAWPTKLFLSILLLTALLMVQMWVVAAHLVNYALSILVFVIYFAATLYFSTRAMPLVAREKFNKIKTALVSRLLPNS